ncbi:MAG TPA: acetyl-CoA carboxylase carboxyl transferase subunit alpha [Spirochaetia bacterium]|nr:MAG: acetyl-CoA carboxylase carboxyltransferase subunit alpha [Spirochaetes bacterium GWB1_36_13]HCL55444.1 acetyl-CoA carboxylase carboxyl transferase subunit alpha [Spirochaetia bacterium]
MVLEFEKGIHEIEEKIKALKEKDKFPDFDKQLELLESKYHAEIEKVYSELNPWKITQIARHLDRPTFLDYINMIGTDFVEIHGDRNIGDDQAMITGMMKIDEEKFFIIGQQKGKTMEEAKKRNFGMPNPEGYKKALRVMKMADKFNRPILTFINTQGAFPGIEAEERGQGEAIARNLREMAKLRVPVVATVIGEGGSGGALGIGVANMVFMLKYSVYSVISPEGCASILWRDSTKASEAAKALKITADDLLKLGLIDGIIDEPLGAAHRYPEQTAQNLKNKLLETTKELARMSRNKLMDRRIDKFLNMGKFSEKPLK